MVKKRHKKTEKNPIFMPFLAIFSLFFIVFFSFFSSAQLVENAVFQEDLDIGSLINDTANNIRYLYSSPYDYFYVLGTGNNLIYQLNVTDFNISTLTYDNVSNFSFASQTTSPTGFTVSSNGAVFYVSDSNTIYRYITTTNYNISTGAFIQSQAVPSLTGTIRDIWITPDGTNLFVLDCRTSPTPTSCRVRKYNLPTPFILTGMAYIEEYIMFSGGGNNNPTRTGFWFNPQGTYLYTTNIFAVPTCFPCDDSRIRQIQLETTSGFNISSPTSESSLSVLGIFNNPLGVTLSNDRNNIWLLGDSTTIRVLQIPPEQIQSIPNINMGFEQEQTINLNTYFTGIGDLRVTATDLATGEIASINSGQFVSTLTDSGGTLPILQIRRTSSSQSLELQTYNSNANISITVVVCSDTSGTNCINDNFILNIDSSFTPSGNPPSSIKNFQSQNLFCTGTVGFNMKDYFSGFTSIRLSYVDFILNETVIETVSVGTPTTIINNGSIYSVINTFQDDILIDFASNCLTYSQLITITAINSDGQISRQFTLSTATSGSPTAQPTAPTGWVGSLIDLLEGVFPNEENLSIFQKMVYVFVTMMLVSMVILAIAFMLSQGINTNNSGVAGAIMVSFLALTIIANVLMFFFFIAIGYINILIPIVIILGLIGLAILRWKSGGQ